MTYGVTHKITDFKIDPEFQNMIPPLTGEEFAQLEENILEDGIVLTPLIVWAGTIVDGHNRYKIIQAHPKLTFCTYEKDFDSRCEALSWICKNQLGRRNLTPQQKKYLIGQRYEAEKRIEKFHGNQHTSSGKSGLGQNDPDHNSHGTRSRIAEETKTTDSYVRRAEYFSQGVNAAEEALPGIKQEILTGSIKPTDAEVAAVAKAPPEERPRMVEQLRVQKSKSGSSSRATPSGKSARQTMQEIRSISEDMERPKGPVSEESILASMEGTVAIMMDTCNNYFENFPQLLADPRYREKVIAIMQEPKNYILRIEGGETP